MKLFYLPFLFLFLTACTIQQPATIEEQAAEAVKNLKLPQPKLTFEKEDIKQAQLLPFNSYNYHLNQHNTILLYFTSPKCPSCEQELISLKQLTPKLNQDILILIVDEQEPLAEEFNIRNTPAKVLLKDGQVILKTYDLWTKEHYLERLQE